jgi:hypothetical protein
MKTPKKMLDEVEKYLFFAFRDGDDLRPGADWQESVMNDIFDLGVVEGSRGAQVLFGRFAWRLSAAACFIALLLLAYVMSTGVVDYQELAMRFLDNPIDFII